MNIAHHLFAFLAMASLAVADEPSTTLRPPTQPANQAPPNVEVIHDVDIGTGGGRTLHAEIARPKNPPATLMPAVIWIHGGGWAGGSYKSNDAFILATKGYFTASIEYRLSGEAKWPAQIEDCKLGVRWLRANAVKYNVNPDRIGCWGSSAGGHLVACLGTMDDPKFEGTGGHPGVSSRVQAVCDFSGPTDFSAGSAGIQRTTGKKDAPALLGLFGAPFRENPELWKDGSPVLYVKPGDPPFLIVHGDKDKTVPITQSENLLMALKKAEVSVEMLIVKGGGHGLNAAHGDPPVEPDRKAINEAVAAFFDEHLKQ
jgi:acetyl esterase/lipase